MDINDLWDKALLREGSNAESIWWLSFCDDLKPTGSKFSGVAIVKAKGLAHAVAKTHELGINPGGEVMGAPLVDDSIPQECFNRLLSKNDLVRYGLIEGDPSQCER